ncbi:hypothetical protein [Flavisphingomonas formosensis]|uniref:hypothetical protein n=1 Tax=Flavisphingomonas formosensis TaxID=861534 RepID=UPI0012F810FF|nr:hypothetical protein [Sphingomonas formosensis]
MDAFDHVTAAPAPGPQIAVTEADEQRTAPIDPQAAMGGQRKLCVHRRDHGTLPRAKPLAEQFGADEIDIERKRRVDQAKARQKIVHQHRADRNGAVAARAEEKGRQRLYATREDEGAPLRALSPSRFPQ